MNLITDKTSLDRGTFGEVRAKLTAKISLDSIEQGKPLTLSTSYGADDILFGSIVFERLYTPYARDEQKTYGALLSLLGLRTVYLAFGHEPLVEEAREILVQAIIKEVDKIYPSNHIDANDLKGQGFNLWVAAFCDDEYSVNRA